MLPDSDKSYDQQGYTPFQVMILTRMDATAEKQQERHEENIKRMDAILAEQKRTNGRVTVNEGVIARMEKDVRELFKRISTRSAITKADVSTWIGIIAATYLTLKALGVIK